MPYEAKFHVKFHVKFIWKFSIIRLSQEYKLQVKLLDTLPDVVRELEIDDKPLVELIDSVFVYLSKEQLPQLQYLAKRFYLKLRTYNSPLIFAMLKAKRYIDNYSSNVREILKEFY